MSFEGKKILLISPEPWQHIHVSKHHYAIHLAAKGADVIFANPPSKAWDISSSSYTGLRVLNYPSFLKGIRWFPDMVRQRLMARRLRQIEVACGHPIDILWSFDNSVFFDFSRLKTLNISHMVDLNQNFNRALAARTADWCFYTSEVIGHELKKHNHKSYFVNHGYNHQLPQKKIRLPGQNPRKALYAGNLNIRYIDWEAMYQAVVQNDDCDFIFLGPLDLELPNTNPTHQFRAMVYEESNTYFPGIVASSELPDYYDQSDLLIMCYGEQFADQASNPHKMMEYLGSGKPIVCSHTEAYRDCKPPILEMTGKNAEFASMLSHVLSNLAHYQSKELAAKRREFALENSYDKQLERIARLISDNHV